MEDKWRRNMVIDRQFEADTAGTRVGWVAITPRGDSGEAQDIHIVATTIGNEGARIAFEEVEEGGKTVRRIGWSDEAQGFQDTAALTMLVETEYEPLAQVYREARWSLGENGINSILKAAEGHKAYDVLEANRIWLSNSAHIMPALRGMLGERNLSRYYPLAYYTANLLVSQETFRQWARGKVEQDDVTKLMMPDASMVDVTKEQIKLVEEMTESYDIQLAEDEAMKRNLTAFGTIPADEIPDAFVESRRKVASAEQKVGLASRQLLTYLGISMPIGVRFGAGRTWPYMDAAEKNEQKAFGPQLRSLQEGQTEFTQRELTLELAELEMRRAHAADGLRALRLLSSLEQHE